MQVTYFCGDASDAEVFDQIRVSCGGPGSTAQGNNPCRGCHAIRAFDEPKRGADAGSHAGEGHRRLAVASKLPDQPIDLFVMYSSTSSILNSPFMGAYAAANTFLDAMAAYRRREGLPALSVSWGTWSETGMAVEGERAAGAPRSMLKGVGTLSNQDGLDALELLLRNDAVHSGVMPMDWEEWRRAYPAFSSMPFFRELIKSIDSSPATDNSDDQFERPATSGGRAVIEYEQSYVDYLTCEIAKALKTHSGTSAA